MAKMSRVQRFEAKLQGLIDNHDVICASSKAFYKSKHISSTIYTNITYKRIMK